MKNKTFVFAALLFSIVAFNACTTSRGYSSGRKGYGCPNSAGIKMEQKAASSHA